MTDTEIIVGISGLVFLALLGAFHLGGLKLIRSAPPDSSLHPHRGLIVTFWAMALLHLIEIALGAMVLRLLLLIPGSGQIGTPMDTRAIDYIYMAGTSFATLGYTQIDAKGPIRLFVMLLALSGFMIITWSATFIFELWGKTYGNKDEDEKDKGED